MSAAEDNENNSESPKFKSPKKHECTFPGCGKIFSRPYRLEQHIRTHTGERPFVCPHGTCDKSYARPAHLKRHIEQTHEQPGGNEEDFMCSVCGDTFCSKKYLEKHHKNVHDIQELPVQHKCPKEGCDQNFSKKHQLKLHMNEHQGHNGVRHFQCPECSKIFTRKSLIDRHKKVHAGYKCPREDCDALFNKWTLLRKHLAFDHRPDYRCEECGKCFLSKKRLTEHSQIHAVNPTLYVCTWESCNRMYHHRRNLKMHIRSFHQGQKFHCLQCGKKLATKQKLAEHIHRAHNPENVNLKPPKPVRKKNERHLKKMTIAQLSGLSKVPGSPGYSHISGGETSDDGANLSTLYHPSDSDSDIQVLEKRKKEYHEESDDILLEVYKAVNNPDYKISDEEASSIINNDFVSNNDNTFSPQNLPTTYQAGEFVASESNIGSTQDSENVIGSPFPHIIQDMSSPSIHSDSDNALTRIELAGVTKQLFQDDIVDEIDRTLGRSLEKSTESSIQNIVIPENIEFATS